jgi:hypothetical protein
VDALLCDAARVARARVLASNVPACARMWQTVMASIVSAVLLVSGCSAGGIEAAPSPIDRETIASEMAAPPPAYDDWPACAKQAWLWSRIVATAYDELPSWGAVGWWPTLPSPPSDDGADVRTPFERQRRHTFGSVAAVDLVPVRGSPLSGGCGLVRISLADAPGPRAITPALALKLFADRRPSTDLSAQPGDQHGDTNVFARAYDGGELRFLPTADAQLPSRSSLDVRTLLAMIDPGTRLFEVFTGPRHVADLVTTSRFVASRYGDEALRFTPPRRMSRTPPRRPTSARGPRERGPRRP